MEDILSVQTPIVFDESIAHYEIHAHQPYTSQNFNNSDEIRISIQHQDLCLLPSKSSLHIVGKLRRKDGSAVTGTKFVNNAICHLFEDIRYEINAIEIDRCKNVGLTSTMKGLISFNQNQTRFLENAGWLDIEETRKITDATGNFDVSLPLSTILGFAEDYQKILVNVKHELILTRSRDDLHAVIQNKVKINEKDEYEPLKVEITRIEWLMPYVIMSDRRKIQLFNFIQKDAPISISFRSWDLYEYPELPQTSKHIWTVKTSNQLEKPRFVILGFQTKRKMDNTKNPSNFDHCNVTNVKLFLNSQQYPYGNLNLDITNNQYSMLYDMYAQFQHVYYNRDCMFNPLLDRNQFKTHAPLIVIDCSKQNEALKQAAVDVRLEFETKDIIPQGTAAYCLILHDRIIKYNPISNIVLKLV